MAFYGYRYSIDELLMKNEIYAKLIAETVIIDQKNYCIP